MKNPLFMLLVTMLLLPSILIITTKTAVSNNLTELKIINPSTGDGKFVFNPNYTKAGDTFTADVELFNVVGLFGWQLNVTYNKNHIIVKDISLPSNHIFSGQSILPVPKTIDNAAGYVVWGITLPPGGTPVSGSGKLCRITFEIVKAPQKGEILKSLIHIDQQGDFYTQILDINAEEIPFQPYDGEYDFSWPVEYPPPTIKFSPEKIIDPSLKPCNTVSFNITIINANLIKTVNMMVTFNSTVLKAESLMKGEILPPDAQLSYNINNESGQAAIQIQTGEPGINGNGSLVMITFHIYSNGTSTIELQETMLTDIYGKPIEHTTEGGLFSNIFLAKITVSPQKIIDPTLVPPAKFQLNITIDDVADLYEYSMNLTFNPEVLSCVGIFFAEPLNETNFTPDFKINNVMGYIQIHVEYYEPAQPLTITEPITLVTLTFRVKGLGYSPFKFENITLKDFEGNLLPYEAYDGLFLSITRDIALMNIEMFPSCVYGGQPINISVTVKNEGDITESFNINIYANTTLIIAYYVENLAPKQTRQINITWDTNNMKCGVYIITGYIPAVPYEKDTTDNEITAGVIQLKLIGDVNGDRTVNIVDIVLVVSKFALYEGHPNWDPNTDLNFDGKIDLKDVMVVIANFGKSY